MQERWGHHAEYVLTLLGYGVGVGTVWKFPYMVARNGGGSFILIYLIFTVLGSIPLTYLEMVVGQYSQAGTVGSWEICPAFKGLGIGAAMLSGIFAIYYPVFFSWILYYLYYSFFSVLPWAICGQSWNTPDCVETFNTPNASSLYLNQSQVATTEDGVHGNQSAAISLFPVNETASSENLTRIGVPSAEEFFRNGVLGISDSLENFGTLRWPLVLCLAITFITVYICIIKGIRLSGKIVYVTVICPYILVTILLVRSCFLPGAAAGIKFYIFPNFETLKNMSVWMECLGFSLYALGISFGCIVKFASHNSPSNNCLRDAILVNICCTLSQIYFGFSVFAITGHLAYKQGVDFDFFQSSGFKLGFITYPEATAYLPLPQLWSVLLFVMLFTLGIDSLVPSYDVVTGVVGYYFPKLTKRRWFLNALVLLPSFLLALPLTAQGGVYLLTVIEWFTYFPSIIVFGFFECVVVSWIYGIPRINKAMELADNRKVNVVMAVLLKYFCPFLFVVMFANAIWQYRPPKFESYIFPWWANLIGWMNSIAMIIPLPVYFVYKVWTSSGETIRQKLSNACAPRHKWDLDKAELEQKVEMTDQNEPFICG